MAEIAWGIAGVGVAAFVFYVLAHWWGVRPLVEGVERAVGREFFPFMDRWMAPREGYLDRAIREREERAAREAAKKG